MSDWLVARVIANTENTVIDRLGQLEIETYLPRTRERIFDCRTSRKRWITRPLFPCYLFVRSAAFYLLFDITGIVGVIMFGGRPAMSDQLDGEIAKLRAKEDPRGFILDKPKPKRFQRGDQARVLTGIF